MFKLQKESKKCILRLLKTNGRNLRLLNRNLTDNDEIVMAALESNGTAMEFVSPRFKSDKAYIMIAIISNPKSITYIDKELYRDKEFMIQLAKATNSIYILNCLDRKYYYDEDVMEAEEEIRINRDPFFEYSISKLDSNDTSEETNYGLLDFIRDNPYNLECLNGELCTDVSLIYEACKQFSSLKKAKYIKFSPKYINAIKTREQS